MSGTFKSHPAKQSSALNEEGALSLPPMDIPGVDPLDPTGLIPVRLMLDRLLVRIPLWQPPPEPLDTPHRVFLFWRRDGTDREVDRATVHTPPPPLPEFVDMYVPLNVLRERSGTVELYYRVMDSEGQPSELDPKRTLTIDMEGPELLRPDDQLHFVDPPLGEVDEDYLNNFAPVRFYVPIYRGRDNRDRVELFLSNVPNPPAAAPDWVHILQSISDPLIAELPADAFRKLNNGMAYLFFQLYDEAGNFSTRGAGLPFVVNLTETPDVPLPRPHIRPPAYDDLLIKRDDARAGVAVLIDPYANWAPGDEVVVFWDGRPVASQPVPDGVVTEVAIPWVILRGPAVDLIPEEVLVRYEVVRLGMTFSSFVLRVRVDLSVAGQDHANAPALLNPNLPLAEVRGVVSDLPNLVDQRDNPAGARARVLLYQNPQPNQILRFFWNGVGPVATYTVQFGDVEGQLVFSSVIPWAAMEGTINPALPFHYTTSNGVNEQQSEVTALNVNTGPLIEFALPVVQHTFINSFLSCCSKPEILNGVGWRVMPHSRFQLNDEIRLFWHGYANNGWVDPVIEETRFEERKVFFNPDELANGLNFLIAPYDQKVFPMREYSTAQAWYQVWRGSVLIGQSGVKRVRIDLTYSTGGYCQAGDVISCSNDGEATFEGRE